MGEQVNAMTDLIRARATSLEGLKVPMSMGQSSVQRPCGLDFADTVVQNFGRGADGIMGYQVVGDNQKTKLTEALTSATNAYERVDSEVADAIKAGSGGQLAAVSVEQPSTDAMSAPRAIDAPTALEAAGYAQIIQTEQRLNDGDNGSSLRQAARQSQYLPAPLEAAWVAVAWVAVWGTAAANRVRRSAATRNCRQMRTCTRKIARGRNR